MKVSLKKFIALSLSVLAIGKSPHASAETLGLRKSSDAVQNPTPVGFALTMEDLDGVQRRLKELDSSAFVNFPDLGLEDLAAAVGSEPDPAHHNDSYNIQVAKCMDILRLADLKTYHHFGFVEHYGLLICGTALPTPAPTDEPTDAPTEVPTKNPTDVPTDVPTKNPTDVPTDVPTGSPSCAGAAIGEDCTVLSDCDCFSDCCVLKNPGFCWDYGLGFVNSFSEGDVNCTEANKCTSLGPNSVECTGENPFCIRYYGTQYCSDATRPVNGGTCTNRTQNFGFCRRALREGEEPVKDDVPLERRLQIIKDMEPFGAKADATFSFMYDLIKKDSCDALIKYMDESLECDIDSGVEHPVGASSSYETDPAYDAWVPFEGGLENQFNKKLYVDQIVDLIGADETMKLIDFFHESLGEDLNIDCMYLAKHGDPGNELFNVPWHKDDYATMEITLNDDYDGGEVLHLNAAGVHKTYAKPGSATAHTNDIVHGITPNTNGAKYMLILKHHFNRPDKEGVVRLSRELVANASASRA